MNRLIALAGTLVLLSSTALLAQDVMQYGASHLKILAEDDRVRVLRFSPKKGDKTPVHSHPYSVLYVLKGGKVKSTLPDGSTKVSQLKSGEVLLRQPVIHMDEALDDVEAILIEIKQ
jgi:quercetin dioxygenase-like cupin family protein